MSAPMNEQVLKAAVELLERGIVVLGVGQGLGLAPGKYWDSPPLCRNP